MIQRSTVWSYDIVGKNILDKIFIISPDLQAPDSWRANLLWDSRISTRCGCCTVGRLCAGKRGEWSIRKLEKAGWKKPPWKHDIWNFKCVCFSCRITCMLTVYYPYIGVCLYGDGYTQKPTEQHFNGLGCTKLQLRWIYHLNLWRGQWPFPRDQWP